MEYSQNGDKPKRRLAETATNRNGDIHFKRTETATVKTATDETATKRNGDKPKRRQTITATSILNEPKRRQSKLRQTETATVKTAKD